VSNTFFARLRASDHETQQVALMLATGFFMGIFIATYQITADSLFLSRLGDQLNKAFLVAGALGILTTLLYSFFQSRIRYTTLTISAALLIALFTVSVYYLIHVRQDLEDEFIFALYCMSGPLTAILLLTYWGTFGRLFNFRQSKRIIGWIDTGQLLAAILASLIIPITSPFVPDTTNYLLLCAISILIVCALLFVIASRFSISKNEPKTESLAEDRIVKQETSLFRILKDPYTRTLSIFLFVSMTAYIFSQFAFQQIVQKQYPNERELTNFTAFFTAAVYILSLVMQTAVNQRVISNYGLRITLLILPVIIGVFAFGSIGTGIFFGGDSSQSTYVFFFVFVALTRLLSWTFRDSLESPVFKLFFIPLDSRTRFEVQSKIEGTFNEVARFTAGLILFCLALLPFFQVVYIMLLLLILVATYLITVNSMYQGYRGKIHEKLESVTTKQEKLERGYALLTAKLEDLLKVPEATKAVFSLKLLEKINAGQIPGWINTLMRNKDDVARNYAQHRVNEMKGLSVSDKYVIRAADESDGGRQMLSKSDLQMIIDNNGEITKARVQRLTRSANENDRQYAAELLLHTSKDETTSYLMELLNDSEQKVRNTAIKTAVKRYNQEVINALIENFGSATFSNQALNALLLIGHPALGALDAAFYRSGQSSQVLSRIIQVMGRIGGTRAKEMLWQKIDYPNKVIVSQALVALGECGFKAGISQVSRIKFVIEADVADIRWNLSALQEMQEDGIYPEIAQAIRWEVQNDIEHIYMLLTMLYDTHSIQLVKENIDSGTTEGIAYAIELLDVFLSEQLKQRVIPVLDDLSDNERIGRLEDIYPRIRLDSKLVLKFLINRDFTQTNRWTKACIIYQIGLLNQKDFQLDLIAHLFNPDRLISEVSAWSLRQLSTVQYEENTRRLGLERKKELDKSIIEKEGREMLFERIRFLSSIEIFGNIPGIILSYLADISDEIYAKEGETFVLDNTQNDFFYLVVSGSLQTYQAGERVAVYTSGQFIGEMVVKEGFANFNMAKVTSDALLMKFEKNQFYELLSDHVKLADQFLVYI
jgi:ATP:ADP antiporter, AAA family